MQRRQVFNPFLPLNEYIPDGEPHVFGDRVYLYGSHDKEGGETFCMLDYTVYSAPVTDLSDWRCEGVIYRASQDPDYGNRNYMYAPDVVRGNDGRYYLYYCMSGAFGKGGYFGPISVAVCDSPAGKYEYLGYVRNPDGSPMQNYVCFDPGVINDNGTIRIYYGTQYPYEEEPGFVTNEARIKEEMEMFGKTREEILGTPDSVMGPCMVVVGEDMLTVKEAAKHIIPYRTKGTRFQEHPFFEASSMRKLGDTYYFIYSSLQNHELCYATSKYPDKDFVFGGTIVSNGDIGLDGRQEKDRLNMTGTTHGSIEQINGQWYVFYHRLTHKSDYSRQACAEKIEITPEGKIAQVEVTSCGLNKGALRAQGRYPAVIACNLTNGHMPHGSNKIYTESFPNVTHKGDEQFIAEIEDGTMIAYKYFAFEKVKRIGILARYSETDRMEENAGDPEDQNIKIDADLAGELIVKDGVAGDRIAVIKLGKEKEWREFYSDVVISDGVHPLYFFYKGSGQMELKEIIFE